MKPLVTWRSLWKLTFFLGLALGAETALQAHSSSKDQSAVKFMPLATPVEMQVAISFPDMDALLKFDRDGDETVTKEELDIVLKEVTEWVVKGTAFQFDGRPVSATNIVPVRQQANFEIRFLFAGDAPRKIVFDSPMLKRLPPSHQQFVTVVDLKEEPMIQGLLTPFETHFEFVMPNLATAVGTTAETQAPQAGLTTGRKFFIFLASGFKHILFDDNFITDHLLFLLALLVVCERFRDVVKIITSFTLAHSLTLALAATDKIMLPPRLIEPLIAATIIYVGLENFFKWKTIHWRWVVTLVFGLIHGFGFATSFKEQALGGNFLLQLVAFNLGVEMGQILVAALLLPVLWKLKKMPSFAPRWIPATSVVVVALGCWWLYQRLNSAV